MVNKFVVFFEVFSYSYT